MLRPAIDTFCDWIKSCLTQTSTTTVLPTAPSAAVFLPSPADGTYPLAGDAYHPTSGINHITTGTYLPGVGTHLPLGSMSHAVDGRPSAAGRSIRPLRTTRGRRIQFDHGDASDASDDLSASSDYGVRVDNSYEYD